MKKELLTFGCAAMLLAACQSDGLKLREDNIDEVIAAMTLQKEHLAFTLATLPSLFPS